MHRSRYRTLFVAEARRSLSEARSALVGVPNLRDLLRAFHTLKGMSATMELTAPVRLAHAAEERCVALLRDARTDGAACRLLAEATASLAAQVSEVEAGRDPSPDAALELALLAHAGERAAAPEPVWAPGEEDTSDAPTADNPGDAFARVLSACASLRTLVRGEEAELALEQVVDSVRALHAEHEALRGSPFATLEAPLQRRLRTVNADAGRRSQLTMEGGEVRVDPAVLGSVLAALLHLLHNAVAHGIEAPAARGHKGPTGQILVRARRGEHAIVISLEDDGRGMDADALARLSGVTEGAPGAAEAPAAEAPVDPSTPRRALVAGRGEGVAAARALVERLGGRLLLTSTPGVGTRAVLHLPLSADPAAGPGRPAGAPHIPGQP